MEPLESLEPSLTSAIDNNWYLVSVRSKKREVFLKYLKIAIDQNKLQEFILDVQIPKESVYEDIVLMNLNNFKTACTHLKKVECFQNIERKPLGSEQVNRMLGIK
ncbi:chromosome segregation ATPase [Cronbergia sp. UHCC 0137]|uniref:chromosome segregation ATPase n=1 Tax=Cronbergia sp. UHCC 0137 TaxID=3110239 RepID=UPI002B20961C|nr:chromosome segregation ATPase [Cronbergia sp. UHCC 0137]MEA5620419.1 chromosome segregation ATPase [Cronbergia sp. UHCC 0137]